MFKVLQIDHVELFVPDRREAARWYERTLGLSVVPEFERWAEDPRGPLMISSDGGGTKLALFTGEPRGQRPTAGSFLEHVGTAPVFKETGEEVRSLTPHDHGQAFSVYFCDPGGHRLEVTTYDADYVRERLPPT